MQGFFITFEGLDGSGKTTQIKRLAAWLQSRGRNVVLTRNPGGTILGERIRAILLDSRTEVTTGTITPKAELALMFADRAQNIAEIVRPALTEGSIVICDRYTDSSEAYQGGGRQLGADTILAAHHTICDDFQPTLTILLLPPLAASLARARRRNERHTQQHGTDENRFEREDDCFYARAYAAYRAIAVRDSHRVVLIEDDASIEAIHQKIVAIVAERLGLLA
ncbi:MAG: dTMP kinase [Acidobacteriaceae bacterium]|nr:dTMP kinase [Acidobacteriaceae bacterium]